MIDQKAIILDVYEILDQLGISRDAVPFLNELARTEAEKIIVPHVLPE